MTTGTEHLTTAEVQQVVQKEYDTARNNGKPVLGIEIRFGQDAVQTTREDLDFFKGRFIIVRTAAATEYIPVEKIDSVVFIYEETDEEE